jgi:hypothetical protein
LKGVIVLDCRFAAIKLLSLIMLDYAPSPNSKKMCGVYGLEISYPLGIMAPPYVDFQPMPLGKSFENYS